MKRAASSVEAAGAGAGAGAEAKRQRPSAAPTGRFGGGSRRVDLLNPATPRSEGEPPVESPTPDAVDRAPRPMDALDAVRAQLAATKDPHLQARLLLRFSEAAVSPGALTDAAIDFLFAFLQENQKASASSGEAKAQEPGKGGGGDAGGSGAIVVGAIVRGLRSLLAVKAAVVEPMIQVDAMGEQLMQCLSVGEDFKLRRDMMRIVVDCLMLSQRFAQVARLLATCVRDHDAGMQAICLRGYLRLHDAGQGSVATGDGNGSAEASATKMGEHFDRLATFLLHSNDEEVRVLAARAIATLVAEKHAQQLEVRSSFFPAAATSRRRLVVQDMAFYVLCMASNDTATSVRAECAVSLRSLIGPRSCVDRTIIEHAVQKTPVEDLDASESAGDDEMRTVRMMSSGALLSLLEDVSTQVAEEASRTIARMQQASIGRPSNASWSERALHRVVLAHFDVLTRLDTSSEGSTSLRQVLVTSLKHLVTCLHEQYPDHEIALSAEQMNSLLRFPPSPFGGSVKYLVTVLSILGSCNVTSVASVRSTLDFALDAADKLGGSTGVARQDAALPSDLAEALSAVGDKCAPVLRVNPSLSERLASTIGGSAYKQEICRALRVGKAYSRDSTPVSTAVTVAAAPTSAFGRLIGATIGSASSVTAVRDGVGEAATLLTRPIDMSDNGAVASYLKAIQRLRSRFGVASALPTCYLVAETLVRLKECLRSVSTKQSLASPDPDSFAHLPLQAIHHCRVLLNLSRSALAKQFALSAACRTELVQVILLARIGVALDTLSTSMDVDRSTVIGSLSRDASRIQQLLSGIQTASLSPSVANWFQFGVIRDSSSVEEIMREFVRVALSAWPRSWLTLAVDSEKAGTRAILLAEASASIMFEGGRHQPPKEPLEVTANWPFTHRVHAVVESVRDISQIFVKSVLPNGETQFHKIPLSALDPRHSSRRLSLNHAISLTVSPFSDPTTFSVAICVRHAHVPGVDSDDDEASKFTEISPRVSIPIFHRTASTLRPSPPTK